MSLSQIDSDNLRRWQEAMVTVEANKRSTSCIYLVINSWAEALNCCFMHSSSYLTPEHRSRTKPSELRQQLKGWKNMKFHKLTHSLAAHFSISHSIPSAGGGKAERMMMLRVSQQPTTAPRKMERKHLIFRAECRKIRVWQWKSFYFSFAFR